MLFQQKDKFALSSVASIMPSVGESQIDSDYALIEWEAETEHRERDPDATAYKQHKWNKVLFTPAKWLYVSSFFIFLGLLTVEARN